MSPRSKDNWKGQVQDHQLKKKLFQIALCKLHLVKRLRDMKEFCKFIFRIPDTFLLSLQGLATQRWLWPSGSASITSSFCPTLCTTSSSPSQSTCCHGACARTRGTPNAVARATKGTVPTSVWTEMCPSTGTSLWLRCQNFSTPLGPASSQAIFFRISQTKLLFAGIAPTGCRRRWSSGSESIWWLSQTRFLTLWWKLTENLFCQKMWP